MFSQIFLMEGKLKKSGRKPCFYWLQLGQGRFLKPRNYIERGPIFHRFSPNTQIDFFTLSI